MPITAEQLQQITANTLDFYKSKDAQPQHIQNKPLLSRMRRKQKTIPGGKGNVDLPIILETSTTLQAFQYDDTVSYGNPALVKRVQSPYRLFHAGIQVTMHELMHEGIDLADTNSGMKTVQLDGREKIALANLMQTKMDDLTEGFDKGQNEQYWRDGTQAALSVTGLMYWIVDSPTSAAVVGGIDQATNAKWRNRANLTISLGDTTGASQAVFTTLDQELPQLRRYGGSPTVGFAGADMIQRMKTEYRYKSQYSMTGVEKGGDGAVGDISFAGIDIFYDSTLDDLGYAKRLYLVDEKAIFPFVVAGHDKKKHTPSRPEDKYVSYSALTWAGGLIAQRRNSSGVYAFA